MGKGNGRTSRLPLKSTRPYRAKRAPGAGILRRWPPTPDSPERHARQGFSYYAFKGWPVASLQLTLSSELAEEVSRTESEIRRLNDDPPRTQLLEAVARQLLRAEAVASSRIEGLELSHRRLAEAAFDPGGTRGSAQSVYANVRAMEEAIVVAARPRALRVADLQAIHTTLFEGTRDERYAGVLREKQNWLGGSDYSPYGAAFIPVPESEVLPLLEDLCEFAERDDLPALLQAAIAHAQFETIHPFIDGNGRVGRCLIHLILKRRGLAPHYVPPISVALAARADAYINGLLAYRDARSEEWLMTFVRATDSAVRRAEGLGTEIEALKVAWRKLTSEPRSGSSASRLIDALPVHPVVDVRTVATLLAVSVPAARLAVDRLADAHVLKEVSGRRRDRTWECVGLFALLDEFERSVATPPGATSPAVRTPRRTRPAG